MSNDDENLQYCRGNFKRLPLMNTDEHRRISVISGIAGNQYIADGIKEKTMNTKKIFTTTLKSLLVVILFSIFTGCNVIKSDLLLPQLMVLRKALATVGLATESNAGAGNPNYPTTPVTPDTPLVTTVDAPIFSPPAGTYTSTQSVSVSTTTTGAILCYTTDGSTPSCDSTPTCTSGALYSIPVSIATTTTLKALACKAGNQYSAVGTGIYTIGNTSCSISPDNISGLKLWLKADSLSQSDGSTVNSWIDSSGNSNTVVAGNAPLFYNNIINGKPVVRFNGSSNRLFKVPASGLGTNYSSFFVIRRNVISTQEMILQLSPAGCTNGLSFYFLNTNALRTDKCGDGASALNTSVFFNNTQPSYFSVHYNGSSVNTFLGGNADTNLNYVMAISPTNIYLGSDSASANFFNGDIAEIIVYNVALNSSERICIDNYIGQKYGLSIATADTTAPTIFSTTPNDNATSIATNATISVTFSESMNAATMTTTTNTTCSGSLQVSADNFTTCIPMTSSTPTSSASDSVFTVTPASLLTLNTTYKIRVTTGVTDYSGNQLLSAYTTTTGFTTGSPPSALTYSGSPYSYTQNLAIATNTPTVTGIVTNCTSSPAMPSGLTLNTTTCAISGTPTVTFTATGYTITASNTFGNTTANISMEVIALVYWDNTTRPRITTWDATSYTTSWSSLASAVNYKIYYWTTVWNYEQTTTSTSVAFNTNINSARKICAVDSGLAEYDCKVINPAFRGYSDLPSREISGNYFDDFNDGIIGTAYSQLRPAQMAEGSGYLQLDQNITDMGPAIALYYNRGTNQYMRIAWKQYSHRANTYFVGGFSINDATIGNDNRLLTMAYKDDWPCYGFCSQKYTCDDADAFNTCAGYSGGNISVSQIFDAWMDLEMIIDFSAGTTIYKLNGTSFPGLTIRNDWGSKIGMLFHSSGWFTGHYIRIDDLSIQSQNTPFP